MTKKGVRAAAFLVLLAALGVPMGCTEAEVLQSNQGNAMLVVEVQGNDAIRYEEAEFGLIQVFFRPLDPLADGEIPAGDPGGPDPFGEALGFLTTASVINLTQPGTEFPRIRLKAGEYRIERIVTQNRDDDLLRLVDDDPGQVGDPGHTCLQDALARVVSDQGDDPVARLPSNNSARFIRYVEDDFFLDFRDDPDPPTFVVPDSGDVVIRLRIDLIPLIELFESAFLCNTDPLVTCKDAIGGNLENAPCLSGFLPDIFDPAWKQYLTIE